MPLIGALLALAGRFVGRLLTMAFGWASLMLFGRVPQSKQVLLAAVALGAVLWAAIVVSLLIPPVADILVGTLPLPPWVDDTMLRLAMLIAAVVLPLLIGVGGLFLTDADMRPHGLPALLGQILRGYPYASALALTLVVLSVIAPIRRLSAMARGWDEAHIPMLVHAGGYDQVADDLEATLDASDIQVERARAPLFVEVPSKVLAVAGGSSVEALVPDRLLVLRGRDIEVTLHPTDVAIAGKRAEVARGRAAIASRLAYTRAYLTASEEAQQVEDRLLAVATGPPDEARLGLEEIDRRLASLIVPESEWEVLYRERLQVERDLLRDGQGPRDQS